MDDRRWERKKNDTIFFFVLILIILAESFSHSRVLIVIVNVRRIEFQMRFLPWGFLVRGEFFFLHHEIQVIILNFYFYYVYLNIGEIFSTEFFLPFVRSLIQFNLLSDYLFSL